MILPVKEAAQMLRIYFGDMSDSIYNTEVFFKNTYEEEWFQDDFV